MAADLTLTAAAIAALTAALVVFVRACNQQNYLEPEHEGRARRAAQGRHPAGRDRQEAGR